MPAKCDTADDLTMTKPGLQSAASLLWLKDNLAVILVLLAFLLFISKSLYNYPIGVMAILGLYAFIKSPVKIFRHRQIRIFVCLFICMWLPMLLGLIDAINFNHSLHTVVPYIRFLFLGIYLILELNTPSALKSVLLGIFCLVTFWCIDAIAQILFTIDFFGYPYEERHITGMFYPKNTIAHICAGLSPLCFELIRQKYDQNKTALLLIIPLFVIILLSGRRATWIMLAVSVVGYLCFIFLGNVKSIISTKQVFLLGLVVAVAMGSIIATHEPTNRRVKLTLGLFSEDYETVNKATAKRLPLWHTSIRIAKDNWINGVGPRGYRHAYPSFAADNDVWKGSGQTHPHQLVLEVLTEAGVIGITGLFVFFLIFYRFIKTTDVDPPAFPWAWAVIVVIFPVNTHMAFYGAYWSSFFWLLLALSFVAVSSNSPKSLDSAVAWS